MIKITQIFLIGITISINIWCGFASNTLVHVPRGYKAIQNLRPGDLVVGINLQNKLVTTHVSHATKQQDKEHIQLTLDDQKIVVAKSQKFFCVNTNKWIKAKKLKIGDKIRIARAPGFVKITGFKEYTHGITLHDIRLEDDHVFCINKNAIVVHNCGLLVVGLVWTFNTIADIAFEKIIFSVIVPFLCATIGTYFIDGKPTKTQVNIQVGDHKTTKTVHHGDQLTSCGSSNNTSQFPVSDTRHCLPTIYLNPPADTGSCVVTSVDEKTDRINTCIISCEDVPQGTCNYQTEFKLLQADNIDCSSEWQNTCEHKSETSSKQSAKVKRHLIKESEHEPGKSCNPICDPPPKGPYGYFIPSEKHKSGPCGDASAGPMWEEGQKGLNISVPVLDKNDQVKKQRVCISNKKYLVFRSTGNDVWHGYYSNWNDLDAYEQRAFIENNLTTEKGKILEHANKA